MKDYKKKTVTNDIPLRVINRKLLLEGAKNKNSIIKNNTIIAICL